MAGLPTSSHSPRAVILPTPVPALSVVSSAGLARAAISRPAVTSNLWSPPSLTAIQKPSLPKTCIETGIPAGVVTSSSCTGLLSERTAPLHAPAAVVPVVRPRRQSRPFESMTHLPLLISSFAWGLEHSLIQEAGMTKPVIGSMTWSAGGSSIGVYDLVYGCDGDGRSATGANN